MTADVYSGLKTTKCDEQSILRDNRYFCESAGKEHVLGTHLAVGQSDTTVIIPQKTTHVGPESVLFVRLETSTPLGIPRIFRYDIQYMKSSTLCDTA